MKKTIEIDVPEGYEYIRDNKFEPLKEGEILESRNILKKKEIEDWEWYKDKYFISTIHAYRGLNVHLKHDDFNNIYFECKIGLLKFICDNINISVLRIIAILSQNKEGQMISAYESDLLYKIRNICPKEFIDSLFT